MSPSGRAGPPGAGDNGDEGADRGEEVFWRSRVWWRRAGHTALGAWAAGGFSILATIVAARALGASEYGSFFLALSVVTTVGVFLDVTLEEATVYYGNRALASGDHVGVRALVRRSLRLDIAVGIVVAAAIVAVAAPLADVASAGTLDPDLIRIMALSVLVTTADSTGNAMLGLARRPDLRTRNMAATAAFRLVGVVIAVQLGGAEAVALSYVLGGAAGSVLLGRKAWHHGWRQWQPAAGPRSPQVALASAWQLLRFSFHTSFSTSVYSISGTLVPILLARAAGPAAVGIFRVAMLPIVVSRTVRGPIRLAMFPEQARLFADGRIEEVRRSTRGYTLIAFGVGSVGAIVGYFLMPLLIPLLYSSSFEAAVTPARILLIAALFDFALTWRKTLLAAIGRPEIRTRLAVVEVAVVVTVMLLLSDLGAEGAAIAVSAGSVTTGVVWLFIVRGLLGDGAAGAGASKIRAGPHVDRTDAGAHPSIRSRA